MRRQLSDVQLKNFPLKIPESKVRVDEVNCLKGTGVKMIITFVASVLRLADDFV